MSDRERREREKKRTVLVEGNEGEEANRWEQEEKNKRRESRRTRQRVRARKSIFLSSHLLDSISQKIIHYIQFIQFIFAAPFYCVQI